jgi:hypothetical protein
VNTALAVAKARIADARKAVETRKEWSCEPQISGEIGKIRTEVQAKIKQLEEELKVVNEQVKVARKATSDAVVALAQVLKVNLPPKIKETN